MNTKEQRQNAAKCQYQAGRNWCECHPETCCCNPWGVFEAGKKRPFSTHYSKADADTVAEALNAQRSNAEVVRRMRFAGLARKVSTMRKTDTISAATAKEHVCSTAELEHLPCPFCGSAPRYLGHKAGFYTERVICDSCHFHLPPGMWAQRSNAQGKRA